MLSAVFSFGVSARAGEALLVDWVAPAWVDATEAFEVSFSMDGGGEYESVTCGYRYPDGTEGRVECVGEGGDFVALVPGAVRPQVGALSLRIRVVTGGGSIESAAREVALAYVEELDITGDPPVVLPYALGDASHLVRYIPCCNIFGAALMASRVPINPKETSKGLPDAILSDFVILEPDELATSTAGTYMQFRLGPDLEVPVVAYEYDWKIEGWREVLSYDVDVEQGTVDFHCPDGGTYVIGARLSE